MTEPRGYPLWMCGFRPFFLLGSAYGLLVIVAWVGFFSGWWGLPAGADGPIGWHAREMLLGFVAASLAGFLLTAVPEFTDTRATQGKALVRLVLLWGLARLGAWLGLPGGYALLGLADIGLLLGLLWHTGAPLLRDRRQRSFFFALGGLLVLTVFYYLALLRGEPTLPWLRSIAGWYMILIVLAMSRISMRIVNRNLEAIGREPTYLAPPPKRNLAIVCLSAHLMAEFALGTDPLCAWLALAVSAAFFNLMGDWHLGRVLLRHRVLLLYAVYASIALGYGAMGLILLFEQPLYWLSGARHLTYIGGIGLAVFAVFLIAGRAHAGLEPDERPWVRLAIGCLLSAALFRLLHVLQGQTFWLWLTLAGWAVPFILYASQYWKIFLRPREDGEWGC